MKNLRDISNRSIFGEYKQKENRITAALLHILKLGNESLINFILDKVDYNLPESEILVETQVKANETIPDGVLSCNFNFRILIESKIRVNEINTQQLQGHKKYLNGNKCSENDRLIYITPDPIKPPLLTNDEIWFNWKQVVDNLKEYLTTDKYITKNDLLEYLIEQFELLIENENLVDYSEDRVIVVGGVWGEDVALKYGFYACQNNRYFKPSKYLTFAFKNRIQYLFEIKGDVKNNINLFDENIDPNYFKSIDANYNGEKREFFYLKLVKTFDPPIINDNIDHKGRRCAFVQRQTYTTYEKIISATKTSEL